MLQNNTSVLARRVVIDGDFATLAYEAGWAREAVVFVQVEGGHPDLVVATEISPDGINWIRRGEPATLSADATIAELSLSAFGNWLRVTVTGASPEAPARILIHVNGKS
ncbi:DUF6385 domain-containing protein [Microbacterium murale]|uniref:DUF6385 domain-containing protein n=1 Tax=Microbacterium murale TaxID=1081040 RepID=A0ABQ1RKD1_9MICO|nr:DUF6385 domain-containing protein [Microbacterium murale]GGD69333.1 hypothetical protein GCM10007269_10560 [Microbacterium murale]